jgi:hypothetical protein
MIMSISVFEILIHFLEKPKNGSDLRREKEKRKRKRENKLLHAEAYCIYGAKADAVLVLGVFFFAHFISWFN